MENILTQSPANTGVIITTGNELASLLANMIPSFVKQGVREIKEEELQEKLLSPEETCKLFVPEISIATLNNYEKAGLVKKYYLGRLTFYKYSEIMASLKSIKRYSRK